MKEIKIDEFFGLKDFDKKFKVAIHKEPDEESYFLDVYERL